MSQQETFHVAWNLTVELHKEVIQLQRQRSQVIGFKITFVSTAIAVIAANTDKFPIQLLFIPAFAAIFFDFLITSFSNSIKRIGTYCNDHLMKITRTLTSWPEDVLLWEEFLREYKFKQTLALLGNLGITGLAIFVAIFGLLFQLKWPRWLSIIFILILIIFFSIDIFQMRKPSKLKPIIKESKD